MSLREPRDAGTMTLGPATEVERPIICWALVFAHGTRRYYATLEGAQRAAQRENHGSKLWWMPVADGFQCCRWWILPVRLEDEGM